MSKNIAIIPARRRSKRIPKKNIKNFLGQPLIAYSIKTALSSQLFDKVIVSTDCSEIAKIAQKYGAEIPFIRPKALADDFSGTEAVIKHTLDYLKEKNEDSYDYVCTIYATAPLLQEKYLKKGLEYLQNSDAIYSFSCTSMPSPIQRAFKINSKRCKMFQIENYHKRSQDLEEAYYDAGQFYWEKYGEKSQDILFGKNSIPIVLPRHLVQDIDTLEDWTHAELLYKILHQ